nr:cell filamentation protein fic [Raoultella sp. NCTC 9187]
MSSKFGDGRDPYLYPVLDVLRNLPGIRQARRLELVMLEITSLRAATIPLGPRGRGLPYLCAIHHQLYQDIFAWAGRFREIDIYQGDTPFCHFAWIEKEGNALMRALEEENYLSGLDRSAFITRLSGTTVKSMCYTLFASAAGWRSVFSLSSCHSCRLYSRLARYRS